MKKLVLVAILMLPFSVANANEETGGLIPDPCANDQCIEEVPLPPPSVPECWPVCN